MTLNQKTKTFFFCSGYGNEKCCCCKKGGKGRDLLWPLLALLALAAAGGMLTITIGRKKRRRRRDASWWSIEAYTDYLWTGGQVVCLESILTSLYIRSPPVYF